MKGFAMLILATGIEPTCDPPPLLDPAWAGLAVLVLIMLALLRMMLGAGRPRLVPAIVLVLVLLIVVPDLSFTGHGSAQANVVYEVRISEMPYTASHILRAQQGPYSESWPLTYLGPRAEQRARNRRLACDAAIQRPTGWTCDEYPFASTLEGGLNARPAVELVPTSETSPQGGSLSTFYRTHNLQRCDTFLVRVIQDQEPVPAIYADYQTLPTVTADCPSCPR